MKETLGQLIQRRMKAVGIKNNAALARKIGRSEAYTSDLMRDAGKTKSGVYTPSAETMAALAAALKMTEVQILRSIGQLPDEPPQKLTTPLELFEAINEFDLQIKLDTTIPGLDRLDREDLRDILEVMMAVAAVKAKRK